MKKKEREHLKDDPFKDFIEKVWGLLQKFRKMIYIGLGAIVAVVVIVLLVMVIKSSIAASENRIYSQAISIKNDESLTIDQKIDKLAKLKFKSGVSASVPLFLATLYFEKGDLTKAEQILKGFPGSGSHLLNGEKQLLEAEILSASDKSKEALNILNILFTDPKSEVPKDYTLLKMAKIQVKNGQTETAVANLSKLTEEYPQSFYGTEARNLLKELEKK